MGKEIKRFCCNILSFSLLCCLGACAGKQESSEKESSPGIIKPVIVASFAHDRDAFTQGLVFQNGKLYESTGLYDNSSIRILDTNGVILKNAPVTGVFAEGCSFLNGDLYQLTWRAGKCIVYTPELEVKGEYSYNGEGWGLTAYPSSLIMSNGSDTLYFRNSQMEVVHKLAVVNEGKPLTNLNELEFARGKVYANVWYSDFIFEISPSTGEVIRTIDCSELVGIEKPQSEQNVLNGIAFVPSTGLFYITGKNWRNMFLVEIPE